MSAKMLNATLRILVVSSFFTILLLYSALNAQTIENVKTSFEANDLSRAESQTRAILKADKNHVEANFYLGKIFLAKNQFDRAERQLKKTYGIDPKFIDVYFELGKLCLDRPRMSSSNKWRLARLYYKKAIENVPESGEMLLKLFETYVNTGEAEKGAKAVMDFMEGNSESASGNLAYAELIKATEHNTITRCDQLYDYYASALKKRPDKAEDYFTIGWGFFTCGDLHAAHLAYEEGLKKVENPDYNIYFDLMVIVYELRKYPLSLAYFLKGYALMSPEERTFFTNVESVPQILVDELAKLYKTTPIEFLDPEWRELDPDILLRKIRHYSIVWLKSKIKIERMKGLELSGVETFEEPYLVHWGKYNYLDYAFHFLLEDDDKTRFLLLTMPEQRENFREQYFREKNPTPLSGINKVKKEFLERLVFVYEVFKIMPNPNKPYQHVQDFSGFDDRGRVYLKYGEPTEQYFDSGGTRRVSNTSDRREEGKPPLLMDNISIGIQNFSDRQPPPVFVKPNQTWGYQNIDQHLFFDFIELEKGYHTLVDDLSDATYGMTEGWMLYLNRAWEGGMTGIYEEYLLEYDRGNITRDNPDIFITEYLIPELKKKDDVIAKYPTNIVETVTLKKPLLTSVDAATFRGENGSTRLELYAAVDYNKMNFITAPDNSKQTTLSYTVVIQNQYVEPVVYDSSSVTLKLPAGADMNMASLNLFKFDLDPGNHRIDVISANPESNKEGFFKVWKMLPSYAGDTLMISDIQIAAEIHPGQPGDVFEKNGLVVVPYPYRQVRRNTPISFYLEVYNLRQGIQGTSGFDITYTATVIKPNESLGDLLKKILPGNVSEISTSVNYTRSAPGSESSEYMTFDLSSLAPGLVELSVEVTDKISGKKTAKSITFQLY